MDDTFKIWVDEDMLNNSYLTANRENFGVGELIPGVLVPKVNRVEIWKVQNPAKKNLYLEPERQSVYYRYVNSQENSENEDERDEGRNVGYMDSSNVHPVQGYLSSD